MVKKVPENDGINNETKLSIGFRYLKAWMEMMKRTRIINPVVV
jgi:hypothetical protein